MIGSARVWRQTAVPAALIAVALVIGCKDRVTQPRGATNLVSTPAHDATPPAPVSVYFRGTGSNANPATLSLDTTAPTGTTAKYHDSPSINFNNGNAWQSAGTWLGAATLTSGTISALGDVHLWLGLKNSDDVGTRFDVRVEAYKNGTLFASGETRCVQSLASGANNAHEVVVAFTSFPAVTFNGSSDVLSIKQLTRVGTNATGGLCGGHSNAVGLRSYFDASNRAATFTLVPPAIVLTVMTNGHVSGIADTSLAYSAGASVPYAVAPQSGFTSVIVFVDSVAAPASGTIVMDRSHELFAVALADTTLPAADPARVAQLRSLVTSPTPVASYQAWLNDMATLSLQVGSAVAASIINAATIRAFTVDDTVALRTFGAAIEGHEFFPLGRPDPVTTPWPTGDTIPNGYPFNMTPLVRSAPTLRELGARPPAGARRPSFRPANVGGPSGPVDPRPVDIVTINGWNTDLTNARENRDSLESLARTSPLFATSPTANFSWVYNDNHFSWGASLFRLACLHRVAPEVFDYVPPVVTGIVSNIPCPDIVASLFLRRGGDQVTQALLQLRDILTGPAPTFSNAALAGTKAKMQRAHSGENHVIFVPHSQGNLYAIQALAAVTSAGAAPLDADSACVGWVPTASPTSVGYPPIGSARMRPVQLEGDIILGRPEAPKFPATPTGLSTSVLQEQQDRRTRLGPLNPLNFILAKGDSIFLHSFRSAYLAPNGGRQLVLDALISVYSFCEPVLTLNAPTFPMSPADTATASVSIAGADGRPMTFIAPVRWSTSDSTVVRVDQSGHLTAVAGGDAQISVRYRGKFVDAIVSVVSTSQNEVLLDVQNTASDFQAPFQFVGWGIMRQRSVVVRAQTVDSTAFVGYIDVYGQDRYGQAWHLQSFPQLQTDGRTLVASTSFFDNPHNADGTPSSFATRNGGYLIMKPDVLVRVVLSTGVQRWYRIPLQ